MKNRTPNFPALLQNEAFQLSFLAASAILVSLLDFLGFIDHVAWLSDRVSTLGLLLLGLYIAFSARYLRNLTIDIRALKLAGGQDAHATLKEVSALSDQINRLVSPLDELRVVEFSNVGEVYDYVADKIRSAEDRIQDITWASYTGYRTEREQRSYENYVRAMSDVCKSGNVMYMEISSLSDSHYFDRAEGLCQFYSYHLAYHDITQVDVPLISFMIVDSSEVVIGFYRIPGEVRALEGIVYLSIRTPLVVKFFSDYYDKIWMRADKLKEAKTVNHKKLDEIRARIRQREASQ